MIDQAPPRDEEVLGVLQGRDGVASRVVLSNGQKLVVFNIAWGYDLGERYAHVTTNISPGVDGAAVDVFSTMLVETIVDPGDGTVLYQAP
ncbi:hypothetical protein KGQ19_04545 [Catenulispora sp. NL8]|uniref:Uncharacterized protein n=1 Tax=Catenulispora pinistramenti TaxID=2705254 RepID=A0ABS5KK95_9ACTN|nr:hypothetical protein [Catenulispora pinistramenti]MBS2546131.1 hypothetical protein [Catenulispora pinistramenti]